MEKQILVIDNNSVELYKLRSILVKQGYNVLTAMDSQTAGELCANIHVDFVLAHTTILDINKKNIQIKEAK